MWRGGRWEGGKELVNEQGASVSSWASLLRISGEPPRAPPRVVRKLGFMTFID